MAQLSVALTSARTYLNDDAARIWTDAVLIPKMQEAHRELQTELWNNGSPVVRGESTTSTLPPNTLTAPLPADLLTPTALFEASVGGSDWTPITEVNYIPRTQAPNAMINYWAWRGEVIYLLASTASRDFYMQYRRLITVPTLNTSPIGIIFGETYLAARAAALAAGAVSNGEAFTAMTALSKENLAKVLAANRGQQTPVNRP